MAKMLSMTVTMILLVAAIMPAAYAFTALA
jgi:hypothetical protein